MKLNDWQALVWGLWRQGKNTYEIASICARQGYCDAGKEHIVTRTVHSVMDALYRGETLKGAA